MDPAYTKLVNLMGAEAAERLWTSTMRGLGLVTLSTAEDRARFGRALIEHGGLLSIVGRSILTQAILRGARETAARMRNSD